MLLKSVMSDGGGEQERWHIRTSWEEKLLALGWCFVSCCVEGISSAN